MIDYFNQVFDVLKGYVDFIFSLTFLPGVSIGSVFLVGTLFWIITIAFWHRS